MSILYSGQAWPVPSVGISQVEVAAILDGVEASRVPGVFPGRDGRGMATTNKFLWKANKSVWRLLGCFQAATLPERSWLQLGSRSRRSYRQQCPILDAGLAHPRPRPHARARAFYGCAICALNPHGLNNCSRVEKGGRGV